MGAFDEAANIILPDPDDAAASATFRERWHWEAHEQVILRGAFTAAISEAVGNASADTSKKGSITFRAGTARIKLMECMILDWTLSRNGQKVPVTMDAIRKLPSNYQTPILERCDELAAGMDEEEQEDFFASANGHSQANLAEMRPSQRPS